MLNAMQIYPKQETEIYNIKFLILKVFRTVVFSRTKDYLENVTMISIACTMDMPSAQCMYELYEQSYLYRMYAGSLIVSIDESDIGGKPGMTDVRLISSLHLHTHNPGL
jgi:hypothetical protein